MENDRKQRLRAVMEQVGQDLPGSELEFRAMFGGIGVFSHGRMFAALGGDGVALKLAPKDRAEMLVRPGAREWAVSRQYTLVPSEMDTPAALRPWVERSIGYVQTLPPPKRKGRR